MALVEELTSRMARIAAEERLWRPGDVIVAAVSGGPDSMALLHALHRLAGPQRLTIVAAHVNHGFRPEESAREAGQVRALCAALGVPLELAELDLPAHIRKTKQNAQSAARDLRYAFLHEAAARHGAGRIALGHHADDQAETVMMRLLRGAGIGGLAGMAWKRSEKNVELIRPLLRITKTEILTYCEAAGVPYSTDSSNLKRDYFRNRVRLDVLPELRRHNPRLTHSLCRLAEISAAEDDLLRTETERLYRSLAHVDTGGITMRSADLAGLHAALQRRLIKLILDYLAAGRSSVPFERIEEIRAAAGPDAPADWSADIGGGLRFVRQGGMLRWIGSAEPAEPGGYAYSVEAGVLSLPLPEAGGILTFTVHEPGAAAAASGRNEAVFDLAGIAYPLTVRSRVPGDRMAVQGLNGTKKVQDMFVDAKIEPARRAVLPLLLDGQGRILWIPGVRRSAHAPAGSGGRQLHIAYQEQSGPLRD